MARQMLSLLAGDAIDLWLVSKLRSLTSEHSMARMILSIRAALWPGGVWFAWANQQREQRAVSLSAAGPPKAQTEPEQRECSDAGSPQAASSAWVPTWSPPPAMRAECFLEPSTRPPDEDAVRAKALERMLSKCPAAVTTLLGLKNYEKGILELHSMLQSSTFSLQVSKQLCLACTIALTRAFQT